MKTIIFFSSLFYLLGLKIGHQIELFKNYNPIEKITTGTKTVKEAAKAVYFKDEITPVTKTDSIKNDSSVYKITHEKKKSDNKT